jgi:hypothetical protein
MSARLEMASRVSQAMWQVVLQAWRERSRVDLLMLQARLERLLEMQQAQ